MQENKALNDAKISNLTLSWNNTRPYFGGKTQKVNGRRMLADALQNPEREGVTA